jgi:hypothetical protein
MKPMSRFAPVILTIASLVGCQSSSSMQSGEIGGGVPADPSGAGGAATSTGTTGPLASGVGGAVMSTGTTGPLGSG